MKKEIKVIILGIVLMIVGLIGGIFVGLNRNNRINDNLIENTIYWVVYNGELPDGTSSEYMPNSNELFIIATIN